VAERARLRWPVLHGVAALPHAVFKFVVRSEADLAEADAVADRLGLAPSRVWVMPEATDPGSLARGLRALAPLAAARGWALSNRLQVQAWGDERGR